MPSLSTPSATTRSVHNDTIDIALSDLSGRPTTYTYMLLNRTRFYFHNAATLVTGLVMGWVVH